MIAILALAGAAYYLMTATPPVPMSPEGGELQVTGSLDDLASMLEADAEAMQAEMTSLDQASAQELSASEEAVTAPKTYDPNTL